MIKTANLTGPVSRKAGGLFESVRRLVQSLAETGMDVRVLGTRDEFTAADLAAWSPVAVSAFKPTWPAKFGYSPRFLEELADFAPDLTHTHGIWLYPSVATNRYCHRRRTPYLVSAHGMLDPWAIRNSRWKKRVAYFIFEAAHLRWASCLRALGEAEARAMRQVGLKNPIAIIPNGIDLPTFVDSPKLMVDGSLRSLKADGWKVLLYLGRIHPKKGLVNLLKAWKQVSGRWSVVGGQRSEWLLAIAGWDQRGHEDELMRLATELGIAWTDGRGQRTEDKQSSGLRDYATTGQSPVVSGQWSVVFLGPQFGDDKAACYRECDAFVLPSLSEGVPMVVLEAGRMGSRC